MTLPGRREDVGALHIQKDLFESYAAEEVPNYGKVWYARNLLWLRHQVRSKRLNSFGEDLNKTQSWKELCHLDSDGDGYST